jgi:hypothetical protein
MNYTTSEELHYNRQKETLVRGVEYLKKYKIVNDFLNKNDWLFVSPLFFQGFELNYLLELSKKDGNQKSEINRLIFHKFFKLDRTATFIEGFCKRCSHIEPFVLSMHVA